MSLCDAVTVMRRPSGWSPAPIGAWSEELLAESMVGRKVALGRPAGSAKMPAPCALKPTASASATPTACPRCAIVARRAGGRDRRYVAGVSGNGQSELLDVLRPARPSRWPHTAGRARLPAPTPGSTPHAPELHQPMSPRTAAAVGLVAELPAWESAVLGYQGLPKTAGA